MSWRKGAKREMHGFCFPALFFHVIIVTEETKESKSDGMKCYFIIC